MDNILKIAVPELGQKEIPGPEHNKRILDYATDEFEWINDDETPWCSVFVNWVAKKAGLQSDGERKVGNANETQGNGTQSSRC